MKVWQKNLILILLVVLIAAVPLWLLPNAEFGGADGQAEEAIMELNPDYEPWFEPILEPASGEVESLLFALQAAIGAGVVGFILGRITKKSDGKEKGTN
ncbi:energy-coupling factor ABC transporter substrate-binding protein [Flavonifractor sp. AGMB03687]|uniref:energy-coupling factor ABC transporter substrate-binding protein n=1 Tax=Flavonifractor sp. AGMB03687 TaxID=2785133 RepID=UPI001ADEE60A|nr:energy-coupling factor ABC transporter substrate-binding protein [Flavonifractor sp. AGMB03687]